MNEMLLFTAVLGLIMVYTLLNGFLDGGGLVSTVIATRAMDPFTALVVAGLGELIGLLVLGRAVAQTIAMKLLQFPDAAGMDTRLLTLALGLVGAVGWNTLMWRAGRPSSSSHALLGGLIGATTVQFGASSVHGAWLAKILLGLAAVPVAAALASMLLSRGAYLIGQFLTPASARILRGLHILTLGGVALVHGSNDGQKSLALVLLALAAAGLSDGAGHLFLASVIGVLLAAGVIVGSRRTVHTIGRKLYRIQEFQGFSAGLSTMTLVGFSSVSGFPMATSHVMSSAILGAGAAVRPSGVRWGVVGEIVLAWIFTIPCAAAVAGGLTYVVSKAF